MKNVRHGDLLLVPQDELPEYIRENENFRKTDGILAKGEATGHMHRLAVPDDAEIFESHNGMYVRVGPNGVSILHEEHKPVTLEPNTTYKVHRAREYDYLSDLARVVRD